MSLRIFEKQTLGVRDPFHQSTVKVNKAYKNCNSGVHSSKVLSSQIFLTFSFSRHSAPYFPLSFTYEGYHFILFHLPFVPFLSVRLSFSQLLKVSPSFRCLVGLHKLCLTFSSLHSHLLIFSYGARQKE